jgi:Flp pilus assembly pilin Flp
MIHRLWSDETGQGLSEYALLVAAVVVLVVAVSILFSEEVMGIFNSIDDYINDSGPLS